MDIAQSQQKLQQEINNAKEYVAILEMALAMLNEKYAPQFVDLTAIVAERDGLIAQVVIKDQEISTLKEVAAGKTPEQVP